MARQLVLKSRLQGDQTAGNSKLVTKESLVVGTSDLRESAAHHRVFGSCYVNPTRKEHA